MKKNLLLILSVILGGLLLNAQTSTSSANHVVANTGNSDLNAMVKKEALQKALSFLNLIPEGREKDYGFAMRSDFSKIKIEEPYQTYYLSKKDKDLLFVSGNEWRVPLSVDGHYVALLTVQINAGVAEAVDFGANGLAQKIEEFEKLYFNPSSERVLIRNTFLSRDYITTNFAALCNQKLGNLIEINTQSPISVYQLNAGRPVATDISVFYKESLESSNNTN